MVAFGYLLKSNLGKGAFHDLISMKYEFFSLFFSFWIVLHVTGRFWNGSSSRAFGGKGAVVFAW